MTEGRRGPGPLALVLGALILVIPLVILFSVEAPPGPVTLRNKDTRRAKPLPFHHPRRIEAGVLADTGIRLRPIRLRRIGNNPEEGFYLTDPLKVTAERFEVTAEEHEILPYLDGRRRNTILRDLVEGMPPKVAVTWRKRAIELIKRLNQALLLENARFYRHVADEVEAFQHADVREARSLKEVDEDRIRRLLESAEVRECRGLISPHLDYRRAMTVYATAYGSWKDRPAPDRVIVFGTSHRPMANAFALTRKDFRTPLGRVQTDRPFVDALLEGSRHELLLDEFLHRDEHSIELQLPFLQVLFEDVPIVPVLCGSLSEFYGSSPASDPEIRDFLTLLRRTLRRLGGETLFVAASDLSHQGPWFGDPDELSRTFLKRTEEADLALLGSVREADAEGFFQALSEGSNPRRICGGAPIYILMRLLGSEGGVLQYRQCLDRDGRRMVSVAAAALD